MPDENTIRVPLKSTADEVRELAKKLSAQQQGVLDELVAGQREFLRRFGALGDLAMYIVYNERVAAIIVS